MGFIENIFHPDRKRQENWRTFSQEVGGTSISDGASGRDEIHIPFMGHRIILSTTTESRAKRTVLTAKYFSTDEFRFKIFGWGGRKVPEVDQDPYLNSEFPDLAPRVKVEFNDAKKLTIFLASANLRQYVLETPYFFTLEAAPGQLCLDNRAHGTAHHGIITELADLHAALILFKSALYAIESIGSAFAIDIRNDQPFLAEPLAD